LFKFYIDADLSYRLFASRYLSSVLKKTK